MISLTCLKKTRRFFLLKCISFSRQSAFSEGVNLQADCQKIARGEMHFSEKGGVGEWLKPAVC